MITIAWLNLVIVASTLFSDIEMVSKIYLYNCPNFYDAFFNHADIEKAACPHFCPCFYKKIIEGTIYGKSCIYECESEFCCCCLKCLKIIR